MLPIPDNPDPDLVRATRRGDRGAFLRLVTRHARAVHAIVEARIPGDADAVFRETVAAFARIHKTLFVVRDLTWFHLFAVRTARAHLDAQRLRADDPGAASPAWMRKLTLGQREALLFATRAAPHTTLPAIEYLGIAAEAYEARVERATRMLREAQEWARGSLPPAPTADLPERLAAAVDDALGEPRPKATGARRMLPRLPLPLAFLLAVGLGGVAAALLFRPPVSHAHGTASSTASELRSGELVPGVRLQVAAGTRASVSEAGKAAPTIVLEHGAITIIAATARAVHVVLGARTFTAGAGRFALRAGDDGFAARVLEGEAWLDEQLLGGDARWPRER